MMIVVPRSTNGIQQSSLGVPLFSAGDLEAVRRQAHDAARVSAAGSLMTRAVVGPYNRTLNTSGVRSRHRDGIPRGYPGRRPKCFLH